MNVYLYCALITVTINATMFAILIVALRWALPRYGMAAMRMAMTPRAPLPPSPAIRVHKPD